MEELALASTKEKDSNALVGRATRAKIVKKLIFAFPILVKMVQPVQREQGGDMNALVLLGTKASRVKKEVFATQIPVCTVVLALMKHMATDVAAELGTVELTAKITFASQTHVIMVDLVLKRALHTDVFVRLEIMEKDVNC